MERLVLATRNRDKVTEIAQLLEELNLELHTLIEFPDAPVVIEDGETLKENAIKKAREIAEHTGMPAVADDTGLEVDALNGAPGVYSSRYAGENASYEDNVRKLLQELEAVPSERRSARFRCVVALVAGGDTHTVEGVCNGVIIDAPRGDQGFGYDPVFFVPEHGQTFAEMQPNLKNQISHRARAFEALKQTLLRITSGRSAVR